MALASAALRAAREGVVSSRKGAEIGGCFAAGKMAAKDGGDSTAGLDAALEKLGPKKKVRHFLRCALVFPFKRPPFCTGAPY